MSKADDRYNQSEKGRARSRRYAKRRRAEIYAARTAADWAEVERRRLDGNRRGGLAVQDLYDRDPQARWRQRSGCIEAGLRRTRERIEREDAQKRAEGVPPSPLDEAFELFVQRLYANLKWSTGEPLTRAATEA